jgi:hypothetical protein
MLRAEEPKKYSTVQYGTVRYGTIWNGTVRYGIWASGPLRNALHLVGICPTEAMGKLGFSEWGSLDGDDLWGVLPPSDGGSAPSDGIRTVGAFMCFSVSLCACLCLFVPDCA